jgi:two-component system, LytTR family, sensor kinase
MYWQSVKAVRNEKKLRFSETQNLQLGKAKLETEYNYLRSQINPHFLYNTLDYFCAGTMKYDRKMAEGIATLSEIMHYTLHPGDTDGKVLLEEEMEQVENYIHLQQLRFNNTLHIELIQDQFPERKIHLLPHLLITLTENAFKHGITNEPDFPVQLKLSVGSDHIAFSVLNRISDFKKDNTGSGIGLNNLKNRLLLDYPDQHTIESQVSGDVYSIRLELRLYE